MTQSDSLFGLCIGSPEQGGCAMATGLVRTARSSPFRAQSV